jgi:hypothetical protein
MNAADAGTVSDERAQAETAHRLVAGVLATSGAVALVAGLAGVFVVPVRGGFLTSQDVVWIGLAMLSTGGWLWSMRRQG